jgi:FHS family L-fucose permease-like MFS transporter
LVVAVVFSFAKLPRLSIETDVTETVKPSGNPLKYKHMWMGVVAIFMYVAAEVSIPTLMVELIRESKMGWSWFSFENAATYGSMYWALVMLGRLAGIFIMQKVQIHKGLIFTSGPALLLVALGMTTTNDLSVLAFVLVGLFNSVMWGAIFPLGIARMGKLTNKASGYMLMGVVGGAIYPLLQGLVADSWGVHASYGIILLPYLFLLYYGLVGHKVKSAPAQV